MLGNLLFSFTLQAPLMHNTKVEASVETLLEWARGDDDRTMLFANELAFEPR